MASGEERRMLRIIVVDDEEPARSLLREYLAARDTVELVAECRDGFEAVKAVSELNPDLMLLDIQMPKLDGFEVLELLDPAPAVIFVTAHDEHALKAFEVHAIDYLLKPFGPERLWQALDRAQASLGRAAARRLRGLAEDRRRQAGPLQRILIRERGQVHVVPVARVDYIESEGDYVRVHTKGTGLRKKQRLNELEELLQPGRFVRVHRCYLLNVDRLSRLEPYAKDSRVAVLTDGTRLSVSRAGYARLKELL